MKQELYRLIFTGKFDQDKDIETITKELSNQLHLPSATLKHLLTGRPMTIKSDIDAETAFHYKLAMDSIGAHSRIEDMPANDDIDTNGFLERRHEERRKLLDRRKSPRANAIQPDRRLNKRRHD